MVYILKHLYTGADPGNFKRGGMGGVLLQNMLAATLHVCYMCICLTCNVNVMCRGVELS